MLHGTDFEVRSVHTVTVLIFFKKGFFYGMIRRTSEITCYFLLFRFALHLVFRGDMNHMTKDLENVNFTTRCFILGYLSTSNVVM